MTKAGDALCNGDAANLPTGLHPTPDAVDITLSGDAFFVKCETAKKLPCRKDCHCDEDVLVRRSNLGSGKGEIATSVEYDLIAMTFTPKVSLA